MGRQSSILFDHRKTTLKELLMDLFPTWTSSDNIYSTEEKWTVNLILNHFIFKLLFPITLYLIFWVLALFGRLSLQTFVLINTICLGIFLILLEFTISQIVRRRIALSYHELLLANLISDDYPNRVLASFFFIIYVVTTVPFLFFDVILAWMFPSLLIFSLAFGYLGHFTKEYDRYYLPKIEVTSLENKFSFYIAPIRVPLQQFNTRIDQESIIITFGTLNRLLRENYDDIVILDFILKLQRIRLNDTRETNTSNYLLGKFIIIPSFIFITVFLLYYLIQIIIQPHLNFLTTLENLHLWIGSAAISMIFTVGYIFLRGTKRVKRDLRRTMFYLDQNFNNNEYKEFINIFNSVFNRPSHLLQGLIEIDWRIRLYYDILGKNHPSSLSNIKINNH